MRRGNLTRTILEQNTCYEALPMEIYLAQVTETKEPIEATDPQIFTDRDDGVRPEFDIRTDRWEIAMMAMEAQHRSDIAKRQKNPKNEGGLPEQSIGEEGAKAVVGDHND